MISGIMVCIGWKARTNLVFSSGNKPQPSGCWLPPSRKSEGAIALLATPTLPPFYAYDIVNVLKTTALMVHGGG